MPTAARREDRAPLLQVRRARARGQELHRGEEALYRLHRMYFERFGYSPNCPKCRKWMGNDGSLLDPRDAHDCRPRHTNECRRRIEGEMSKDPILSQLIAANEQRRLHRMYFERFGYSPSCPKCRKCKKNDGSRLNPQHTNECTDIHLRRCFSA